MSKVKLEEFFLTGLALQTKTTNTNGQSAIDCGNLWQEFEKEKYAEIIPGKVNGEILAVYHQYEADHTAPFSYFIGCKVKPGSEIPKGLQRLFIPAGTYQKITAKGNMPDCLIKTWNEIWHSDIPRSYQIDFEVYGEKSSDWNNAEVEIYISIEP